MATVAQIPENEQNILIAAPTGFLTSCPRPQTPDIVTCETVHASFHIPVDTDTPCTINWELSQFDIIIIDEISMISEDTFKHILYTWDRLVFRPVLVPPGDGGQQQPFAKVDGYTQTLSNPLNNPTFVSSTYHYVLTSQHRVGDVEYLHFLDHIRSWVPKQNVLDELQNGRVLCPHEENINGPILQKFPEHPTITVLAYMNKGANIINTIVTESLFKGCEQIARVQLDAYHDNPKH